MAKDMSAVRPHHHVCVYCGSGEGKNPRFADAARMLGKTLAKQNIGLVYGGGGLGLMGEIARATIAAGGYVSGIIPTFLTEREQMLTDGVDLSIVEDMHQRKMKMFELADAFVALPGGVGTLEELVEQLTWSQLGRHTKPILVANIDGFWDPFLALLSHMREETFIRSGLNVQFRVVSSADEIVPAIEAAWAIEAPDQNEAAVTAKF